jgi:RNA polymerase sigma-70 factor (ECF subfamily)
MSGLPDDQRVAIELHHLQGLPLSVAADQLGRSKEAVASLLYRALKRLKKQLDADEGE